MDDRSEVLVASGPAGRSGAPARVVEAGMRILAAW